MVEHVFGIPEGQSVIEGLSSPDDATPEQEQEADERERRERLLARKRAREFGKQADAVYHEVVSSKYAEADVHKVELALREGNLGKAQAHLEGLKQDAAEWRAYCKAIVQLAKSGGQSPELAKVVAEGERKGLSPLRPPSGTHPSEFWTEQKWGAKG